MKKNIKKEIKLFKNFNNKKFKINISWLIFDKLFRASLNIVLTIILARNLGPENFGILNYLLAFLYLFTSISSLGMNPVLTNKIIKDGEKFKYNMVLNAYYIRFIFSILCYLIFLSLINLLNSEGVIFEYSIIIGLVIIMKSSEIFFSYFEAKSLSKYIVISQLLGLLTSILIIIYVFINNLDNKLIYIALLLDFIIVFVLINYFYFLKTKFLLPKIELILIKKILCKSLPVLVSALSIILYMRIDQIMIKSLINEYEVGIYSASVRLIEIFHFIPKILIISFLPIILKAKEYYKQLLFLNSLIFKISIVIFLIIFFSSSFLVKIFYGDEYLESVLITKVLSFSIVFVFFGVINEHWYIKNNLQLNYAFNVFLGAIINIILNYFLILKFGSVGAAVSTLITYIFIIFIFDIFNQKTYGLLILKFKSIFKI